MKLLLMLLDLATVHIQTAPSNDWSAIYSDDSYKLSCQMCVFFCIGQAKAEKIYINRDINTFSTIFQ